MAMQFSIHGEVAFTRLGQILVADVQGPWNAELIELYKAQMTPYVAEMAKTGPWGLILVVHNEAACPPDAIEGIRRGVIEQAKNWHRVCTSYVIAPDVLGYRVMDRVWLNIYRDVIPCEIFEQREDALAWTELQLAEVKKSAAL